MPIAFHTLMIFKSIEVIKVITISAKPIFKGMFLLTLILPFF
jgi:hypothetical protein